MNAETQVLSMTGGATTRRGPMATIALLLAVIAAVATLTCSVIIGLGLGPLEARQAYGQELPDDAGLAVLYLALALSNVLWTILGITALVLGIVAAARRIDRPKAVAAIVVAGAAPLGSFGVWLGLTLMTSPLG